MKVKYLLLVVIAIILAGCSTLSQVSEKGTTDIPVFPNVKDVILEDGTFPNLENLRNVEGGLKRDQVYDLIGRPHFSEGFGTREWDYLFHFRTVAGIETCQFKVLFDKEKVARSFHWAPESCANTINPPVAPEPTLFVLDGNVIFDFDSAELTSEGYIEINKIANNLKQHQLLEEILVAGHTDRMGSVNYNNKLSLARANAVRRALIREGISSKVMEAIGYGKSHQIVACDSTDNVKLISCLAPNRRVEITASGISKK